MLQDVGHQLLSHTIHAAECSSNASDTAPIPSLPSFSNHPHNTQKTMAAKILVQSSRSFDLGGIALVLSYDGFLASSSKFDFIACWVCPCVNVMTGSLTMVRIQYPQYSQYSQPWEARAQSQSHSAQKQVEKQCRKKPLKLKI